MRELKLREYETSEHALSTAERDALQMMFRSLTIQPVTGIEGVYRLTPGSTVGAVEIDDMSVIVEPKIGIQQLLSIVCYAMSRIKPRQGSVCFREYVA